MLRITLLVTLCLVLQLNASTIYIDSTHAADNSLSTSDAISSEQSATSEKSITSEEHSTSLTSVASDETTSIPQDTSSALDVTTAATDVVTSISAENTSTSTTTTPTTAVITTTSPQILQGSCSSAPCKNGATCTNAGNGVLCACACGYTGQFCDILTEKGACWSSPCKNGGTCYSTNDEFSYRCLCDERYYTGYTCEIGYSPCNSNPCRNRGICNANLKTFTYTCSCGCDFTGKYCETDLNPCGSQPCLHGGSCYRYGTHSYVCACAEGYAGLKCDYVGLLLKTNLALGRPVYQSSLVNSALYSAKNVVDGSRDFNVSRSTCTATTATETHPWIAVDFGKVTDVKHVVVTGWTYGSNGNYENCKITTTGAEYTGTIHVTEGRTCVQWELVSHLNPTWQLPENYCRNPDNKFPNGPWCYYKASAFYTGYCDVPVCATNHIANFMVGLTNTFPPVYGQYSVCARYPGVLHSPTVSLTCAPGTVPGRYLVLQIPLANTAIDVCEIEAYTNATLSK